jgi:hypothetical protein
MSFHSQAATVIARKVHRCTNCGQPIGKGEAYQRWTSVDDRWFTSKMHPECHASLLMEADGNDFEYTPYGGERPGADA